MSDYQIAVLDIGKTNKKLFVYDSDLRCLNPAEKGAVIPEVTIDGILCDDMASIWRWMIESLRKASETWRKIRCISISAHGATIALLGEKQDRYFPGDGGLVFPIVSYMQQITPQEEERFYEDVGEPPGLLQILTATARFGCLINHGKQIHWLKTRFPERFDEVTGILMYSQYLSYLLSGRKDAIEPTYIGCHGYLLDKDGAGYSGVAAKLGITDKLPPLPLVPSWHVMGLLTGEIARETGLSPDTIVTVGVHDSNAAIVPYFITMGNKFIVQDTGTWVVTMTPVDDNRFPMELMGKEIFFNRSVYGGPVKTTIFRGGAEFDYYRTKVFPQFPRPAGLDAPLLKRILKRRDAFILPTVERGSGLYPESPARIEGVETVFRDPETAWCVFDVGLAIQGYAGINIATHKEYPIVIEGNIGRNSAVYRSLISTLYEKRQVFIGSTGGAPYGAAILGAAAVEGKRPEQLASRVHLSLEEIPKLGIDSKALDGYVDRFFEFLTRRVREKRRPTR